jgi:uncharacterized protein (TIGR00725 family)
VSRGAPYVAVCGPGDATADEQACAEAVGAGLARAGAVVVCGGLGGVMEAACRGAAGAGGVTIGVLPGLDRAAANEFATVAIPTGMGELRNGLIVRAADAVIAVGGAYGTLSEVALALKTGTPVFAVGSWDLPDVVAVDSAEGAVSAALAALA